MNSGEKIRFIRIRQGMTAEELSNAISMIYPDSNMSISLVSAYERGIRNPSDKTLIKFANALHVSIEALRPDEISTEVAIHTLFRLSRQFGGVIYSVAELRKQIRQELLEEIKKDDSSFDTSKYLLSEEDLQPDDMRNLLGFINLDIPIEAWARHFVQTQELLKEASKIKDEREQLEEKQIILDNYADWQNNFSLETMETESDELREYQQRVDEKLMKKASETDKRRVKKKSVKEE
ncbi:MAG: helix-turn-helix domain-containing protein [Lachnospiraceae bacterium]|nr:helix-turn-helix domain-containing protein [Lachnospiraceae bacterium]